MANIKISELNEKTELNINDIFPVVDMTTNETKKITGANLLKNQYSTNEIKTNMVWINGKPVYRKVIDTGALPNSTSKYIPHNISNLETIVSIQGIAKAPPEATSLNYNMYINLPNINASSFLSISVEGENLVLFTQSDYGDWYTSSQVVLEYTKTN